MLKTSLATTLIASFSLALVNTCQAADSEMEKCRINTPDGESEIKAGMADCAGGPNSCAGANKAGDPNAWIYLPKGVCGKITGGTVVAK
ncbi:MAG: DUF2282 domain-containing protein [Alphaproteobacteria bacterium]|nr:DUF2282 domain-containing protein [Alphaproteobacteria bacterium]